MQRRAEQGHVTEAGAEAGHEAGARGDPRGPADEGAVAREREDEQARREAVLPLPARPRLRNFQVCRSGSNLIG